MNVPARKFETVHAEPGPRPLWIGLFGPSGGGKTYSALRLAMGIRSVIGGKVEMIDTESGRGKHYAETFDYEYTAFPPPHGSLDYLAAINHAVNVNKSRIVIIDSLSHEHEGEGGLIEFHDEEVTRMGGGDNVKMLAWGKPKAARKQLLREMIAFGTDVVFILCFRADDQSKPVKDSTTGKQKVVQMGFMPIAGKPFVYEATVCALLMPGANGVPTWEPENVGERLMKKNPEQFKALFEKTKGQPMSEAHGKALAEWSVGGVKPESSAPLKVAMTLDERVSGFSENLKKAKTAAQLDALWTSSKGQEIRGQLEASLDKRVDMITGIYEERSRDLREGARA